MTPSFNRFDPFEAMNDIDNSLSDTEQFYLGVGNDNSSDDIKFFFNKDKTAYLIVTDYHGKYKDEHPIDGKILGIAAKKEARGTGDTDKLISRAKKYFSNDVLVAEVDKDNIASQRLVRRNGFKKVFSDEYIDYYVWQKDNNSNIQMENYKMIKSYDKILNEGFDTLMKRSLVEASGSGKIAGLKLREAFHPTDDTLRKMFSSLYDYHNRNNDMDLFWELCLGDLDMSVKDIYTYTKATKRDLDEIIQIILEDEAEDLRDVEIEFAEDGSVNVYTFSEGDAGEAEEVLIRRGFEISDEGYLDEEGAFYLKLNTIYFPQERRIGESIKNEACVNNKKNRRGENKSLNESFQSNLNHEIYNAIGDVCWEFFSKDHEPTREELEQAISYFFEKWFEDDDLGE